MKYIILLLLFMLAIIDSLHGQTTIEPNSITLGIDQINMVEGDTILHWRKARGALRAGVFRSDDITNANTGRFSFAHGTWNKAIGDNSIAMGSLNNATGVNSFAIGDQNEALFTGSVAIGKKNVVNYSRAVAIGDSLIVNNENTIIVGAYNDVIPFTSSFEDSPIFVVGNGDSRAKGRSNAITVLRDGRMSIRGKKPESDLHLVHIDGQVKGGFRLENEKNGNWWRLYTRSGNNNLALYNNTSIDPNTAVGEFSPSGVYTSMSDRRLKEDIIDIPYGIDEVLLLEPKRYKFKHVEDYNDLGFIAQDVLNVIPEIVSYNDTDDEYMLNYDGFGILAIKAIQDLHELLDGQKGLIAQQNESIELLKTQLHLTNKRLEKLE